MVKSGHKKGWLQDVANQKTHILRNECKIRWRKYTTFFNPFQTFLTQNYFFNIVCDAKPNKKCIFARNCYT